MTGTRGTPTTRHNQSFEESFREQTAYKLVVRLWAVVRPRQDWVRIHDFSIGVVEEVSVREVLDLVFLAGLGRAAVRRETSEVDSGVARHCEGLEQV